MVRKRLIARQNAPHVRGHLLILPAHASSPRQIDLHILVAFSIELGDVLRSGVGLPRVICDVAAEIGGSGCAFARRGLDGGFGGIEACVGDVSPAGGGDGG